MRIELKPKFKSQTKPKKKYGNRLIAAVHFTSEENYYEICKWGVLLPISRQSHDTQLPPTNDMIKRNLVRHTEGVFFTISPDFILSGLNLITPETLPEKFEFRMLTAPIHYFMFDAHTLIDEYNAVVDPGLWDIFGNIADAMTSAIQIWSKFDATVLLDCMFNDDNNQSDKVHQLRDKFRDITDALQAQHNREGIDAHRFINTVNGRQAIRTLEIISKQPVPITLCTEHGAVDIQINEADRAGIMQMQRHRI